MPLYPKKFQPYFLDPNSPNRYSCAGEYLYPVIPSDLIYWQGYQTPCGTNVSIDPDFENSSLGSELLSNGGFVGSLASWTPSTQWTWNPLPAGALYTGSLGGGTLTQGIAATIGLLYEVTFTISGSWNGGTMNVLLGTSNIAQITDPGTYTVSGVYGAGSAELTFEVPATSPIASLLLSSVSCKERTMTSWDGNGEWTFADGSACKSVAGTGVLNNDVTNYIVSGNRYRLTFTIAGNTQGSITPKVGTTASAAQTGNGVKTVWVNALSNGTLSFTPSATWDGCISGIDIREMKVASDFTWQIISDLGDGDVYDLTDYVELHEDDVTLIYDPQDDILPIGCYILRIYDTCTVQYEDVVINGTFFGGSGSTCPDWFLNNGAAQYDFAGDDAEFIYTGTGGPFEVTNPSIFNTVNPLTVDGNYQVTFDIVSNTDTTNIGVNVRPRGATLPAFYSTVGTHTYTVNNYAPADDVLRAIVCLANFSLLGVNTPGSIVIDNVQVVRIAPFEATYTSVGIQYKPNQLNTRLIRGYCDTDNLGYAFEDTDFYIQQRVRIRSINPVYPSQVGIMKSGNGDGRLYYAEMEKYFTVFTDLLDESAHDAMAVMLKCEHFEIQNINGEWIEYLSDGDPYEVQWFPGGNDFAIAPAIFQIRIKEEGQIFNRKY